MNPWYKNKALLAAILVLVVGGFFLFGGSDEDEADRVIDENIVLESGEIVVEGEIACLPYKAATAGQGCVKGIEGNDGRMYALNSIEIKAPENALDEGEDVIAIGKFEPANTTVNDSSVFTYDGVLVLRLLEKR